MTLSMPELIGVLARLNAENALEKLDDTIVDNCRFGMSADFCFQGHERDIREALIDLAEKYYDKIGGRTNLISYDDKPRNLTSKDDIRKILYNKNSAGLNFLDADLSGFYIRHAPRESARSTEPVVEYFSNAIYSKRSSERAGDSMTYYYARFSDIENANFNYLDYFIEVAQITRSYYGCAGAAIIPYSYYTSSIGFKWPIFQRFVGFHYSNTYGFRSDLDKGPDLIPTSNWLTAINDVMFERLGGEAAAKQLAPDILLHRYDGGVVFQAGQRPRLGDLNIGDVPQAYRDVARFLRPVRFDGWRKPFLRVPSGVDKIQATRDWTNRFDT